MMNNQIFLGDNLDILPTIPKNWADLIYIDPPFNTGDVQQKHVNGPSYRDDFETSKRFSCLESVVPLSVPHNNEVINLDD